MTPESSTEPGSIGRREFLARGAAVAGLATVPFVVDACGSSSSPGSATASAANGAPKYGGTLKVAGYRSTDGGLDPADFADNNWKLLANQPFENLLYAQPVPGEISGKPIPLLATVEPNSKYTAYQVTVHKGIHFSDGTPLTVDDVLWTFRRSFRPKGFPFGTPGAYLPGLDVKGIRKLSPTKMLLPFSTANTSAMSDLTIYPLIYKNGANSFKTIKELVGTGPFKWESYTPNVEAVFEKNEHYWQSGKPYLDKIIYYELADDTAKINSMMSGQTNVIHILDTPDFKQFENNPKFTVKTYPSSNGWYFYMKCNVPPFTDARVREAFRLAVQRPQLVDAVLFGGGQPGNDVPGKGYPSYTLDEPQRMYDPEKAKALLKQAGQSDVTVTGLTYPDRSSEFAAFAQSAKAAGITIKLRTLPQANYYSPQYWPNPPTGFAQTRWSGSFEQLSKTTYLTNSPDNETGWKHPSFDALYKQALGTPDASKRNALYGELQRQLWESGGSILWGFESFVFCSASDVHGFRPWIDEYLGGFDFRNVYIS